MNILFFDSETTGLVKDWNNPSAESNPRMVQLGMVLCNKSGRVLQSRGYIIRPTGYEIPKEASDVHGITTELAEEYGYVSQLILHEFVTLYYTCDILVAHNIKFDKCILSKELLLHSIPFQWTKEEFCTMLSSTMICKIPKKNGNKGYKWPKLEEAYEYFFKEKFIDAHDALSDVLACKRIYFEGLKISNTNTERSEENLKLATDSLTNTTSSINTTT